MRVELDLQKEITVWGTADAGPALSGEPYPLTLTDALRNLDVEGALAGCDPPVVAVLRRAQRDRPRRSVIGILEIDDDLCVVVLAPPFAVDVLRATETTLRATETTPSAAPEQGLEEVAELARVKAPATAGRSIRVVKTTAAAPELPALIPVRRRSEVLAGLPVGAELVIGG